MKKHRRQPFNTARHFHKRPAISNVYPLSWHLDTSFEADVNLAIRCGDLRNVSSKNWLVQKSHLVSPVAEPAPDSFFGASWPSHADAAAQKRKDC